MPRRKALAWLLALTAGLGLALALPKGAKAEGGLKAVGEPSISIELSE